MKPFIMQSITQNQVILYDLEDADKIEKYKWHAVWYKNTKSYRANTHESQKDGKRYYWTMSRLIMGLQKGDKRVVDHINHDTLDNRKENLRVVTSRKNILNPKKKPKGYRFEKRTGRWQAQIRTISGRMSIGCYDSAEEAEIAYLLAKEEFQVI